MGESPQVRTGCADSPLRLADNGPYLKVSPNNTMAAWMLVAKEDDSRNQSRLPR